MGLFWRLMTPSLTITLIANVLFLLSLYWVIYRGCRDAYKTVYKVSKVPKGFKVRILKEVYLTNIDRYKRLFLFSFVPVANLVVFMMGFDILSDFGNKHYKGSYFGARDMFYKEKNAVNE